VPFRFRDPGKLPAGYPQDEYGRIHGGAERGDHLRVRGPGPVAEEKMGCPIGVRVCEEHGAFFFVDTGVG
jgi:hypothetical protein